MGDIEETGSLYLGKHYDPQKRKALDEPVLYQSKDLTAHAICVGMTGSGKTELCIDRLEEAALETIPAIVVKSQGRYDQSASDLPRIASRRIPREEGRRHCRRLRPGLGAPLAGDLRG